MNKYITSKRLAAVLIIVIFQLSLLNLITLQLKSKIIIEQNNQSINISLDNGQYIVLRPEADYIIDPSQNTYKPFGGLNEKEFYGIGIDFLFIRKSYVQKITSNDNTRNITINPLNQNSIEVQYNINTNLYYGDTSTYTIQIDYSKNAEFKNIDNNIVIEDKDCKIEIENTKNIKIEKLISYPSFILTKAYSDALNFEFRINQTCK